MLFCLMSSLENCLISTYLLWFSTRVRMEKNWGDTPSATLNVQINFYRIMSNDVMHLMNTKGNRGKWHLGQQQCLRL